MLQVIIQSAARYNQILVSTPVYKPFSKSSSLCVSTPFNTLHANSELAFSTTSRNDSVERLDAPNSRRAETCEHLHNVLVRTEVEDVVGNVDKV